MEIRTKSATGEDLIAEPGGGKNGKIGNLTRGHGLVTTADKEQQKTPVREITAILREVRIVRTKTRNRRRVDNIRILGSILGSVREREWTTIITDNHGSGQQTTIHKVMVVIRGEMVIIPRAMVVIRREMTIHREVVIINREVVIIHREVVVIRREMVVIHEEVVVIRRKMHADMIASRVSKTHLYLWDQS